MCKLAKLHREKNLIPLEPIGDLKAVRKPGMTFANERLSVRYLGGNLTITFRDGHAPVVRNGAPWKAPVGRCENPEFLGHVFAAPAVDAIVAEIAYEGTDTCWEPSDQLHVVTW